VLNNPLALIDPKGLYDWAANCSKNDNACNESREEFRKALAKLEDARNHYDKNSFEYKDLNAVLSAYGTEGDGNNVQIAFTSGPAASPAGTQTKDGITTVRFDDHTFHEITKRDLGVEYAATLAHEGTHILQQKYGLFAPHNTYARYFTLEKSAYTMQSFVNKAFHLDSIISVWNESWRSPDSKAAGEYDRSLNYHATQSARFDCGQDSQCKKP
jgi:hypothetical protein